MMVNTAAIASSSSISGYSAPNTLAPSVKKAIERRVNLPAERKTPNPKYPQLEEAVTLLQTVGTQPLSLREIALSILAAGVFSLAWGAAKKSTLTFYKLAAETSIAKTLVRKDVKDELGTTKPEFYYTSQPTQINTSTPRHWKQWEESASEESSRHQTHRQEQLSPCNPWLIDDDKAVQPAITEKYFKQSYNGGQSLTSTWQDADGVNWALEHARENKFYQNTGEDRPQGQNRGLEIEPNSLNLEIITWRWADDKNPDLEHLLTLKETDGIEYSLHNTKVSSSATAEKPILKNVNRKTIEEIETVLTEISYLPASLKNIKDIVKDVAIKPLNVTQALNKTEKPVLDYKLVLPENLNFLTEQWWGMQEKNQPLVLDAWQTFVHKVNPFVIPSIVGAVGAGLGLLSFHWLKEKRRNQTVIEALGKAKTPETITYAEAKKYQLLG